jgi:hypothetical protein
MESHGKCRIRSNLVTPGSTVVFFSEATLKGKTVDTIPV